MMVMGYIDGGSLRRHLQNNYDKLDLKDKLNQLSDIAKGLKDIHEQGLVHGDFHAGNILNKSYHHNYRSECFITDLGLCRPASEEKNSGTSYGVMPYVAPEILLRKPYTQASDIYSFGIVAYEIFYNTSPHFNSKYDFDLALSVCEGLRPNLEGDMKLPQLLKDLIKRCWDADPKKRLNSSELNKFLED
jgi:serine/threonine protein kinase